MFFRQTGSTLIIRKRIQVNLAGSKPITTNTTSNTVTGISVEPASASGSLAGTVPSHLCYILLHTPQPPAQYPSRKSSAIQRALQLKVSQWGGIVNFSWSPDPSQPRNTHGGDSDPAREPDVYPATAFSASRGRLDIPELSLANVDDVEETLREHARPGAPLAHPQGVHLYVCTHGARDCRCGDVGGRVVRALREELEQRRQRGVALAHVNIGELGHVGGHKHAANLLVFPHGEWLGNLRPGDAPGVMDAILDRAPRPMGGSEAPLCPPHWRGRMGLTKDEQIRLLAPLSYSTINNRSQSGGA